MPASACLLQQKLGAHKAGAFDLNAACSGFIYSLSVGTQFIRTGVYKRILIVCMARSSHAALVHDWKDRGTCILFGDGAAAVVLEATPEETGLLSFVLGSRGDVEKMLTIEGGGGARPSTSETVVAGDHLIRMRGNEVFKLAVRNMTHSALQALEQANLKLEDMKAVIPHQANRRIVSATQEALGVPAEKVFVNVERYGNTGAASIPIALCEYLEGTPARAGDHFLFAAFGGGCTWASAVVRWAELGK